MLSKIRAINDQNGSVFIFNIWLALCALGLIMVTSVSVDFSLSSHQSMWYFSLRHSIDLGIALGFLVATWLIPIDFWFRYHKLLFVLGIAMLALLHIPEISFIDDDQRRWIGHPSMAWQPTELFKFLFVIYIVGLLSRKGEYLATNKADIVRIGLITLVPVLMLLMQHDYGTALIIVLVLSALLLATNLPLKIWSLFMAAWLLIPILKFVIENDLPIKLWQRLSGTAPTEPLLTAVPVAEVLVPVGLSDWWGLGLGRSIQKMTYLSEAHTTNIFAVLGEELGFISAVTVMLLFLLLMLRGSALGWYFLQAKETFIGLLAIGVTLLLVFSALLNISINLGLLPSFNASLPFVGYGANHLIVSSALIGVLLSCEDQYSQRNQPHAR